MLFSGPVVMVLGGLVAIIAQIYYGFFLDAKLFAGIFGTFGSLIFGIGFALWKWDNRWRGKGNPAFEEIDRSKLSDRSLAIIPPPRSLPVFDPDTGRRLCSFYFYDADNRLPCLSGCEYPESKHGACTRDLMIPSCPYPNSRSPIVKSMMPKQVAWCPGPGGCTHFNEMEYKCQLKTKGISSEVLFLYERKSHHELTGTILMAVGLLPTVLQFLSIFLSSGFSVPAFLPLIGVFIAAIGAVVYFNAS